MLSWMASEIHCSKQSFDRWQYMSRSHIFVSIRAPIVIKLCLLIYLNSMSIFSEPILFLTNTYSFPNKSHVLACILIGYKWQISCVLMRIWNGGLPLNFIKCHKGKKIFFLYTPSLDILIYIFLLFKNTRFIFLH